MSWGVIDEAKRPGRDTKLYSVLDFVENHPGVSTSDLARAMGLTVVLARGTLWQLERRHLLARDSSPKFGEFDSHWRPI